VKVILREDVRDLGHSGELVEVKDGHARNYLLPRSLAVPATEGNLKAYNKRMAVGKEREERERAVATELGNRIRGKRVLIIRRAAEGSTRLHGSVTSTDVAEAIGKLAGKEIDRRDVDLRQPIRALGEYQVALKLMRGMTIPIQVLVAESEPVEEPTPEPTPEPVAEAATEIDAAPDAEAAPEPAAE
jgi:large subunit ribosomal protein L9